MKSMKAWAIGFGVLAILCAACSTGDDDNEPPPTGTNYYAYVANNMNDTVSGYSVNTTTGAWTAVPGSPFAAGDTPNYVVVDPRGKFVFVANYSSSNISVYAIKATTGTLSEISGSPFITRTINRPYNIAVDSSGRFLYVRHVEDEVTAFSINSTTGALTEIAGSPYSIGPDGGNSGMMVDPHGYYLLYVANYERGVYGYTIDFDTGALSLVPGSPFHALNSTWALSLAMDPRSKFFYLGDDFSGITLFGIDWASGQLALYGSWLPAPDYPWAMAVDPKGKFLYATDVYGDEIFGYIIDSATGALTGVFNSPFSIGNNGTDIAFDAEGKFAYVGTGSSNMYAYAIDPATGVLTPLSGSPFPVAGGSYSIAIVKITY
jgi:6-phosphogluconolactonase (cycloisomerase 2 family)